MESRAVAAVGSIRPTHPFYSESQAHVGLNRVSFERSCLINFLRTKSHLGFRSSWLPHQERYLNFTVTTSHGTSSNANRSLPWNFHVRASNYMSFGKPTRETVECSCQIHSSYISQESKKCVDKCLMGGNVLDQRFFCFVEDASLTANQLKPAKLRKSIICQTVLQGCAPGVGCCSSVAVDGLTLESNQTVSLATPPMAPGWLSVGVCGNALIARAGNDGRCFHQPKNGCEWDHWPEGKGAVNNLCAHAVLNASQRSMIDVVRAGSSVEALRLERSSLFESTITKKIHSEKLKKKNVSRQKKRGRSVTPARDLYGRSSFHLCEVIFSPPFVSSNIVSDLQCLSGENLKELVAILNKLAVGIAGSGVALMLFVVSRMLAVNASLDSHMIVNVACGLGFISLAWAMKRVAAVVCCMADTLTRSRSPKKEQLISLKNELHWCALNALPLIVLCFVRLG